MFKLLKNYGSANCHRIHTHEVPDFIQLEMDVAQILQDQEEHGWAFDEEEGWKLATKLKAELATLEQEVREKYPFVPGGEFTPKRDNSTAGYICGATMTRLKDLNPTSRDHLIWILKTHYRWKPTELTGSGKPILDEKILTEIGTPIAMKFLRMLTITKYLGMLTEGQNAWLKLVTNGRRIHHHCSVATNTHRCAHRKPNLSQVPSGDEFRRLLYQVRIILWLVLTCLGLSFAALLITFTPTMVEGMQTFFSQVISTKPMQTR